LANDRIEAAFDLLEARYDIGHTAVAVSTVSTITTGTVAALTRSACRWIARAKRAAAAEIWSAHGTASEPAKATRSAAPFIRSSAHSIRSSHSIGSSPRKPSIG
jgi:hypothetical protein